MIERIVLDYLNDALDTPVYMEVPETGVEFVVLEKTGSGRRDYVNEATFAIQSYAESMEDAAELNELVKEAMDNIIVLPVIGGSKLNSDYNFTDTDTKRYRYQCIYVLYYV